MSSTVRYLDACWSTVLGCSAAQLRDGARHVVAVPECTGVVRRPWPLRPDAIAMLTCGRGWVLSVPSGLRERAIDLCASKSLSNIAAEGDAQGEEWFARGARDDQRAIMRGPGAYPTLARLAEGLQVRCWSHYFHWYCDPDSRQGRQSDEHVRELTEGDPALWRQWVAWPGPCCRATLGKGLDDVSHAFGYVLKGKLVSVAQIQASTKDFAWEFGVDTLPAFRRRGFATAVAEAATRWILNRGQVPWYYYDHYNHASAAIPRKLGYFLYAEGLFSHV